MPEGTFIDNKRFTNEKDPYKFLEKDCNSIDTEHDFTLIIKLLAEGGFCNTEEKFTNVFNRFIEEKTKLNYAIQGYEEKLENLLNIIEEDIDYNKPILGSFQGRYNKETNRYSGHAMNIIGYTFKERIKGIYVLNTWENEEGEKNVYYYLYDELKEVLCSDFARIVKW